MHYIKMPDLVQDIFDDVLEIMKDGLNLDDLPLILGTIRQAIQHRGALRGGGERKKDIAISVFKKLIEESGIFTQTQTELALLFVDQLPALIDAIKGFANSIRSKNFWCC